MTVAVPLADLAATVALGRRVGAALTAGDVVLLSGPLGAGKTVLVRGIVEGLGSLDEVVSPTFVLVRQYQGRLPVVHADLYRLDDPAEVDRLGLLELAEAGVLVVEWAERGPGLADGGALRIRLDAGPGEGERVATVLGAPAHLAAALDDVSTLA